MKRFFLGAILSAAFIIGCGAAAGPMVGTWELQLDEKVTKMIPAGTEKPNLSVTFAGDGTWTGSAKMDGKDSKAGGTYTLDGKKLTMVTTSEDGKPKDSAKTETATLADDEKSFALPGMEAFGKMVKK